MDSYRNLTLKSRSALEFYIRHCQSEILILLDDDILIRHLSFFERKFGKNLTKALKPIFIELSAEMVICLNSVMIEKEVIRKKYSKGSKWSVTKTEYENDIYPNFCQV